MPLRMLHTRELAISVGEQGGVAAPGAETASLFALEVRTDDAPSAGKTLILLHGGPGASHDYLRPQLDALASPRRRLLYYDQRGSGRSRLPAKWKAGGIAEHLADLDAVLDEVVGAEQALLLGYSWGGLLALHYALEHPQRLERLLLVAPAPAHIGAREIMRQRLAAAATRPDIEAWRATLDKTDRRHRFASMVAGYFVDPRLALVITPFVVHERAERGVWDSLAGYDLRPRLSRLAVPTRIIHGTDDPIPIESARDTAQRSGADLVELPACGHVPYVEQPDRFLAAARAFLDAT